MCVLIRLSLCINCQVFINRSSNDISQKIFTICLSICKTTNYMYNMRNYTIYVVTSPTGTEINFGIIRLKLYLPYSKNLMLLILDCVNSSVYEVRIPCNCREKSHNSLCRLSSVGKANSLDFNINGVLRVLGISAKNTYSLMEKERMKTSIQENSSLQGKYIFRFIIYNSPRSVVK